MVKFYTVKCKELGTATFDNKADADFFASHKGREQPVEHDVGSRATIRKYNALVTISDAERGRYGL